MTCCIKIKNHIHLSAGNFEDTLLHSLSVSNRHTPIDLNIEGSGFAILF